VITLASSAWKIIHTPHKGRAIVATQDIPPGTMIGDYTGNLISYEEDNESEGLYSLEYGKDLLIFAQKKDIGLHLLNHSCVPNCGMYPYRDHMLFVSLRKIFAGEELTVSYMIEPESGESDGPRACYCGSEYCTGTWFTTIKKAHALDALVQKEVKKYFKKRPGKKGDVIGALSSYPKRFVDNTLYDLYGNPDVSPILYKGKKALTATIARAMIRKTGAYILDTKAKKLITGVRDGELVTKKV
jgi:hypothetical protein